MRNACTFIRIANNFKQSCQGTYVPLSLRANTLVQGIRETVSWPQDVAPLFRFTLSGFRRMGVGMAQSCGVTSHRKWPSLKGGINVVLRPVVASFLGVLMT